MVSTIYKVEVALGSGSLYVAILMAQWQIPYAANGVFSVVAYASLSIVPLVVMLFMLLFEVFCVVNFLFNVWLILMNVSFEKEKKS